MKKIGLGLSYIFAKKSWGNRYKKRKRKRH